MHAKAHVISFHCKEEQVYAIYAMQWNTY